MTLYESLEILGKNTIDDAKDNLRNKKYYGNSKFGPRQSVKNNTGSLYNSLKYTIVQNGNNLDIDFDMNDYGYIVDKGRLPGNYVPIEPLEDWLKKRGLNTDLKYAISKSIYKTGIPPTYFFSESFEQNNKVNTQQLLNEVDFLNLGEGMEDMEDLLDSLDDELQDIIVTGRKKDK